MKLLPLEFVKRRFRFRQLCRTESVALYEQFDLNTNVIVAFEVFEVKTVSDRVFGGNLIKGGEVYPGDSVFGTYAWSVAVFDDLEESRERAIKRYDNLNLKLDETKKSL